MRTTFLVACLAATGMLLGQADVWAQGRGGGRGGREGGGGQRSAAPRASGGATMRAAPSVRSAAPETRAAPSTSGRATDGARIETGGRARVEAGGDTRDTGGRARVETRMRPRVDADAGTRTDVAPRARVDADTGTRAGVDADGRAGVDANARTRLDAGARLSDSRVVSPTRVRVGSGFRDGMRFWNGSNWVWGFGPRYGYWDGFGWGFGPWDRYGAYWGGYRPGVGYWDDFYAGPSYYYGAPSYVQPAVQSRTALGITMDERGNAVFVRSVIAGSPADQAGLRPGDMIIAINGELISSADQVTQIVAEHRPGDELNIETDRNGRELRTAAVLEERQRVF
jgi:PDZ domain-containing protein